MRTVPIQLALGLCLGGTLAQPAAAQTVLASIEGEWTSDCLPIGRNDRHGTIIRLTIRDGVMEANSQLFARNTCHMPTVQANFGGELTQEARENGHLDLEIVVEELTTTPNRAEVVEHYNRETEDQAGCGLTNWKVNHPVSTAGLKCGPFTWPDIGGRLYESAWVEGDELRFGALPFNWTNTSSDKRPSEPSAVTFYRTGL